MPPAAAAATAASPASYLPQPTLPADPARSPDILALLLRLITLTLSLGLHDSALFLSERLLCLLPTSEEAVFYHSLALLRSGQPRLALELLRSTSVVPGSWSSYPGATTATAGGGPFAALINAQQHQPSVLAPEASLRCGHVYAEACIRLDRASEAQACLQRASDIHASSKQAPLHMQTLFPTTRSFTGTSADALLASSTTNSVQSMVCVDIALAQSARKAYKADQAAARYLEIVKTAWWCWEAYEGLCALNAAPESSAVFPSIPVPTVSVPPSSDPPYLGEGEHDQPPPADFLAAQPISAQNSRQGPGSHFNAVPSTNSNGRSSSITRSGIASTPVGHAPHQQSFVHQHGFGGADRRTPQSFLGSAQGAGLQFGDSATGDAGDSLAHGNDELIREDSVNEAEDEAWERSNGMMTGNGRRQLSMSMDDIPIGDGTGGSSFFAAPSSGKPAGLGTGTGAGLFGFGRAAQNAAPSAVANVVKRKGSGVPLFGSGLLFGNAGSTAGAGPRAGSFFTPPNHPSEPASANLAAATPDQPVEGSSSSFSGSTYGGGGGGARPPPAVKRSRGQVDADDSMSVGRQANGAHKLSVRGEMLVADPADAPRGVHHGTGDVEAMRRSHSASIVDEDQRPSYAVSAAPRKGSVPNLAPPGYARRSSRLGSSTGANGAASTSSTAMAAKTAANSNNSGHRDRKRSKAGPASLYDETASDSHSFESNTQHGRASSSSSPPPMPLASEGSQGENVAPHFLNSHRARSQIRPLSSVLAQDSRATTSTSTSQHQPSSAPLQHTNSAAALASYKSQVAQAQAALAQNWLRSMYAQFATAHYHSARYENEQCVRAVLALEKRQRECPRALELLGRAHFEALNYPKAEEAFTALRQLSPYTLSSIDVYSTLLWHLHRPVQLSYLAQELMLISPLLPQAWIATGNVFSHLEDHANALKAFKRAIQADEACVYAYTLAGHEATTLEEWETALGFFREAVRRDERHYNAWFGLGNVYMKTGKHRLAEYHFRRASSINPTNAMLVSCVGSVLEKLGGDERKREALECYERACLLAPTSPAVRFKRVRMLMELRQFEAALRDLLLVRDMAPNEFNVHYLLGKLYGAMGDGPKMTKNLTLAQDLEPRAAGRIREIIENAGRTDDDSSDEEDGDVTGAGMSSARAPSEMSV